MRTRTLNSGRTVAVHDNKGLRKRCGCPRRTWLRCPHPWHFAFKWGVVRRDSSGPVPAPGGGVGRDAGRPHVPHLRGPLASGRDPQRHAGRNRRRAAARAVRRRRRARWLAGRPSHREDTWEAAFTTLAATTGRHGRPAAGSTWNKYRALLLALQRWGLRKGYLLRPWLGAGGGHHAPEGRQARSAADAGHTQRDGHGDPR